MGTKMEFATMLVRMLKKSHISLLYFLNKMKNILKENQPERINDVQSTIGKRQICRAAQT
jgi:hypothetical protein